jgi:predicted DNA-binding transcriptional regulator YafY
MLLRIHFRSRCTKAAWRILFFVLAPHGLILSSTSLMPVNKAARYRFEVIDECLRNTARKWSKADLLTFINRRLENHFGTGSEISVSQLRYDLENMQTECNAPIEMYKEGKSYFYKYEDPSFSIKTLPVSEEDLVKLNDAVQLLQQISGFTIADDVAEVVKRLENRYKFTNTSERRIISFETATAVQGIENLEDIYHAIIRKKVLKITYKTFQATEPRIWNIHPYLLKEHSHRWYLLGLVEEKQNTGIFALDRMQDIRISRTPYRENSSLDADNYFNDVIGVTVLPDQQVEEIELIFSSRLTPYILSKPLHQSQIILKQYDNGNLHIQLRLMINPELLSLLLSYGNDVKVIRPAKLADEIRRNVIELLKHYE